MTLKQKTTTVNTHEKRSEQFAFLELKRIADEEPLAVKIVVDATSYAEEPVWHCPKARPLKNILLLIRKHQNLGHLDASF